MVSIFKISLFHEYCSLQDICFENSLPTLSSDPILVMTNGKPNTTCSQFLTIRGSRKSLIQSPRFGQYRLSNVVHSSRPDDDDELSWTSPEAIHLSTRASCLFFYGSFHRSEERGRRFLPASGHASEVSPRMRTSMMAGGSYQLLCRLVV